jgi:hypothetical protein
LKIWGKEEDQRSKWKMQNDKSKGKSGLTALSEVDAPDHYQHRGTLERLRL